MCAGACSCTGEAHSGCNASVANPVWAALAAALALSGELEPVVGSVLGPLHTLSITLGHSLWWLLFKENSNPSCGPASLFHRKVESACDDSASVLCRLKWYTEAHVFLGRLSRLSCSAADKRIPLQQLSGSFAEAQNIGLNHMGKTEFNEGTKKGIILHQSTTSPSVRWYKEASTPETCASLCGPRCQLYYQRWSHDLLSDCLGNWFKYGDINAQPWGSRACSYSIELLTLLLHCGIHTVIKP